MEGGSELLREVEREARRRGVDPCRMGFKAAHAAHMKTLLAANGYGPFEITWIKWLAPPSEGTEIEV